MQNVLDKIKPSKEEIKKLNKIVNEILSKIDIEDTKAILGGSGAKGTWLKNTHDIDVFVKFNYQKYKNKSDKISQILEKNLKSKFKIAKLHGSRDYFQIKKDNITFEIVPILDIKNANQAKNITDVSPLHAKWVKKHNHQDEILLTKAFARAQKVYGAETHIKGFSGYVLEILTIYYGSFKNLVNKISKWKERTIIDIEKHHKNPLKELNKSKLQSPLILIDPVDKSRNAAAVLSKEKYDLFIKSCKNLPKNPTIKDFTEKQSKIPKSTIKIKFSTKGKKDVIGGKLYSAFEKLKKQLILNDFKIKKSGFILEENAVMWIKLVNNTLSKYHEIRGPPILNKKHLQRFKEKHKKAYTKDGISYAKEKRKFTRAKDLINDYFKKNKLKVRFT